MIDAGTQEGQTEGQGDCALEIQGLGGDVALIVVQRQYGGVASQLGLVEYRIGADGADHPEAALLCFGDGGHHFLNFLIPEQTMFTAVRV